MKFLEKILPHISIIISMMLLVLFVLDKINDKMVFLNDDLTKAILAIGCVFSIATCVVLVVKQRRGK